MKSADWSRREELPDLSLRAGCEPACRGCRHRTWTAQTSEAQKIAYLSRTLAPWADRLAPIEAVAGEARWQYRDKVTLTAEWHGGWRFGLVQRGALLPIHDCPLHTRRVHAVIQALASTLPPPDGFALRYLVQSGAQVVLILKQHELPRTAWLAELAPQLAAAGVEGFWLHLHPAAGRRLFARSGWHLLWGAPRSRDADGLVYGPAAFRQPIPALHRRALDEAEAFLAPRPGDAVIDLYCGIGASLVRWTARGADAVGVELAGEAVACALVNAPRATVLRGTCSQRLPQLDAWLAVRGGTRLAYLNPPRSGLEADVACWLATQARPARLACLSCSAGTLARDLQLLESAGWRVARLAPYDFFPQTHHVEVLALLER
ncbi:MAG TPA: class I SAM-dependent RNA methyltransferase [Gammaproteobacteria bacterium]|nr:class I SAM-dependent RNA methyltransferase [Gammaproteobacteria bacterium]